MCSRCHLTYRNGVNSDTANQTLYFSADGTTASEQTLAQVQPGVTLHPHDILIV